MNVTVLITKDDQQALVCLVIYIICGVVQIKHTTEKVFLQAIFHLFIYNNENLE
jgi:hypothetical protein